MARRGARSGGWVQKRCTCKIVRGRKICMKKKGRRKVFCSK